MNKIAVLFFTFLCVLLPPDIYGQLKPKVKYWVHFKNKNGTPYSLSSPSAFLSAKSISRRSTYNIPYHYSDLPVPPAYVKAIDTIKHVDVLYVSKWLNGVVVAIDSANVAQAALSAINNFTFVLDTTKVKRYKLDLPAPRNNDSPLSKPGASTSAVSTNSFNYGRARAQTKQLNLDCLHENGYRGQGMTIAVMDVGFTNAESSPIFDSLRANHGVLGGYDFVSNTTNYYQGGAHGTEVLSTMAGNKPGVILGTAPLAKYWLLRTEDGATETISEEYNWIRAAEFADSVGTDIITTSLGYTTFDIPEQNHAYSTLNGRTAPMSIAATMAARKGIFVLNAAGNEGGSSWKYISVPGDADSICTVGAVDTAGVYAGFSSVGPTADNRIKPDLVATGAGAWGCDESGGCYFINGTSFSTPILAGATACFWQSRRELNNIQLLDTLKMRGSHASKPDNKTGWGIPKLHYCVLPDLPANFTAYYNSDRTQLFINLEKTNYDYISLEIVDLLGRVLFSQDINKTDFKIQINPAVLADGVYLAKVRTSKGTITKKFYR